MDSPQDIVAAVHDGAKDEKITDASDQADIEQDVAVRISRLDGWTLLQVGIVS